MSQLQLLTQDEFSRKVKELEGGHWTPRTISNRWDYYSRVVELIKSIAIDDPAKILEMGTMGISCVDNGHTIDYEEKWAFPGKKPTIVHDARQLPWPVANKQYELFIALRVFQHLAPVQGECVKEAMRIAQKVILVVPNSYDNAVHPASRGITYRDLAEYNGGIHPNLYYTSKMGDLYYFDTEHPSRLDIEAVLKPAPAGTTIHNTKPSATAPSLYTRVKAKLRTIAKG